MWVPLHSGKLSSGYTTGVLSSSAQFHRVTCSGKFLAEPLPSNIAKLIGSGIITYMSSFRFGSNIQNVIEKDTQTHRNEIA
jgi:hypothetical protein